MSNKTCGECRFYHPIFKHEGVCTVTSDLHKTCDFTSRCAVGGMYPKSPPTVFTHITVSPEVLADRFLYFSYRRWRSSLLPGMKFWKYPEAYEATVAKLKEAYNETTSN